MVSRKLCEEEFILAHGSRGDVAASSRHGAGAGCRELTSLDASKKQRSNWRCSEGHELSKSVLSEMLPPARLQAPQNSSKQRHQVGPSAQMPEIMGDIQTITGPTTGFLLIAPLAWNALPPSPTRRVLCSVRMLRWVETQKEITELTVVPQRRISGGIS